MSLTSSCPSCVVKRKYALIKVKAGDYLLPSNDAQTIWRIYSYTDGPSMGLDLPRDRTFWGVRRWMGSREAVDIDAWDRWFNCGDTYDTRAEAIEEAMRL